ncbi:MAG: ABC transporter permease [Chloroflexi bacterium]|nr:ABC transporter permease [Chloroflexota bacterium]
MVTQEIAAPVIAEQSRKIVERRWYLRLPLRGLMLPVFLLLLWWLGAAIGTLDTTFFSTPIAVMRTLGNLLFSGVLLSDFGHSLLRILIGASIGFAAGVVLGGITGYARQVERVLDPTIQALRAVPAVAWIPFLILTLGIDNAPKIALIAIAIFFITYVNTFSGVRGTDQKLIELAHAYRLPRSLVFRRIILPAALPQIFVGLRLAAAIGWIAAVFSEILVGNNGLGVLLNDGRSLGRPDQTIVLMIVLALSGKSSDGLIRTIERRVTRWRATFEGV